jgi:hypothetical protein
MKVERTSFYVISTKNGWAGQTCRRRRHRAASSVFDVQRAPGRLAARCRLVARWRVCPQTRRLECTWSLEAATCDDLLCRHTIRRWRGR